MTDRLSDRELDFLADVMLLDAELRGWLGREGESATDTLSPPDQPTTDDIGPE